MSRMGLRSGVPSPMAPSGMQSPLLETQGLVKRFGALVANDRVDLAVRAGEIHALLGENGAGKSTLVKMLYGLLQPDAGHILWEGRRVVMTEPRTRVSSASAWSSSISRSLMQ